MGCRTNKTRSLYRSLARQYFNIAKGYATAFETLSNDQVIGWFVKNGIFGLNKIEFIRKKKENLCDNSDVREDASKKPKPYFMGKSDSRSEFEKIKKETVEKGSTGDSRRGGIFRCEHQT
jgi:hypothetical protein